ncbi:uncharacterized protein METZ01_LOCUS418819, partial [marine metagenome]
MILNRSSQYEITYVFYDLPTNSHL